MIEGRPLGAYPNFRADTVELLCESVNHKLAAKILRVGEPTMPVAAAGNLFHLPSTDLWFCSYGLPISLKFAESDFFRIQFYRAGVGATWVGDEPIPVTARQSCIASAATDVDFGLDFQQFAWRVPRRIVNQKLAARTGRPVTRPVEFDHRLDMLTTPSAALREIFDSLVLNIDSASPSSAKLVLPELENALIVSLLCTAQHNYRDLLDGPTPSAAPWQVLRAERYIEAHWDEPITIEDMVSATGASARSIFRAFKKSRGYSPFQFVKELRLQQARRMLDSDASDLTVTEVAVTCGFENLSRFSKDFSRAFGELRAAIGSQKSQKSDSPRPVVTISG